MPQEPTLTLEEIEKARRFKADGLTTQQIMARIARERLGAGQMRMTEATQPQGSVIGRTLRDIPSDIAETARNVQQTSQRFGEAREAIPGAEASRVSRGTAALLSPFAQTASMAGDVAFGAAKLFTTPEAEQKIGETFQQAIEPAASRYGQFRESLNPEARFQLENIVEPGVGSMLDVGLPGAGAVATRAVGRGVKNLAEEAARAVPTPAVRPPAIVESGITPEARSAIVDAYNRAIKPNFNQLTTPQKQFAYQSDVNTSIASIVANKDNLQFVDEVTGEVVRGRLPENLKEYTEAIDQTKRAIFDEYNTIAEQAGEAGAFVDNVRVANALDEIITSKRLRVSSPETIRYAEELKQTLLRTPRLSILEAQDIITDFNNQLAAFYSKATPEAFSQTAVKALVANRMREAIDESIGAIDGTLYQSIKSEYGALKAIERDVMRAYLRDARRNVKGLIDFTDVLSGGQVVSGILSFNPAMVGQGIAQKAIAEGIKAFNDPNRAVRKIFEQMNRYAPPKREGRMPTRKALPAAEPGAPRSEVRTSGTIRVPERDKIMGVAERNRGVAQRSDSEPRPTETERALRDDDEAVAQAVAEMEAEMTGGTRTSFGENKVQGSDGSYYRFNELPSWVPTEFRDGALMSKVMENITYGKKPRGNATNEIELQKLVETHIKRRAEELKKGKGDQGVFSGDAAFAAVLMAGGTYFLMSEEGDMLPVVAIGSMMLNPGARKAAAKSAREVFDKGGKLNASYKRKISEALEGYDTTPLTIKEGGRKRADFDPVDMRIEELQQKNYSGTFTDKDALEAEELMAKQGVFVEPDN